MTKGQSQNLNFFLFETLKIGAKLYHMASGHNGPNSLDNAH